MEGVEGMQAIIFASAALLAAPLPSGGDPFVGKWVLDVPRSLIVDDMQVEAVGPNKYAFNFEGAPTETVVADGSDQPGLPGTTLAVKTVDGRNLTVVRKQKGQVVVSAKWKLSPDSRILYDAFTSLQADGSMLTVNHIYRRTSGGAGFAGRWESTTKPIGLKLELEIQPYGDNGLRFVSPGSDKSVAFDGKEHPAPATAGLMLAGTRSGLRKMKYTETNNGKLTGEKEFELSPDRRTLTETVHLVGQALPDVLVFERQ
jgi:hypothetical protein